MAQDFQHIDELIALGTNPKSILHVQELAKQFMKETGNGYTLTLACAATLSCFLTEADIPIAKSAGAGELARRLQQKRGWRRIAVGNQNAGDVGVTIDADPKRPGADHIYLVVGTIDNDLMFIADNQVVGRKHQRTASGVRKGAMSSSKTRTDYFLRAPEPASGLASLVADQNELDDADTNALKEPYDDDGVLINFTANNP